MVTSQAQGLINLGNTIGDFFGSLGESIGSFFSNLWSNISTFFADLPGNIANIWNSFVELLQYINPWSDRFFLKIAFTMNADQEAKHENNHSEFDKKFREKIPFVGAIIDEFQKASDRHQNVSGAKTFSTSNNPLNLSIGSFSYDSGSISYETQATDLNFILEKYEPYRLTVRNGLMLVVYGLGIVYLVKYVLNYGVTEAGSLGVAEYKSGMKGDD